MKNNYKYKEYQKNYRVTHKKQRTKKAKIYYIKNIEQIKIYNKFYYKYHKQEILIRHKSYPEKLKKAQNKFNKLHKTERRIYKKEYNKNRRKIDINFKIVCYLRSRLSLALKNNLKSDYTMKLLGCSIKQLKQHLSKRFYIRKDGLKMLFDNYGLWHIDHIKPCAKFDLSKVSEQKKCFNYKNLQPLWAEENIKKGIK